MKRALIAMSGGVDSSVAALAMVRDGWECAGCTMRLFDNADAGLSPGRTCCSLEDVEDARSVAFRLGMPYHVFNFTEEFRKRVMEPFAAAYRRGETPNPCLDCNRYMKFDLLLRRAEVLGFDVLVTGHYARITFSEGRYHLRKALDKNKDQSYVLYMLSQTQLARLRLPLGELTKPEVRAMAEEALFRNAEKRDSQDICFVPDGDHPAMIRRFTGEELRPGNFVDRDGRILGCHRGIECYTVGQRRGLGIPHGERLYVCAIRPENNTVVLGPEEALLTREVCTARFHWIAGEAPVGPVRGAAKVRYRQKEQPVTLFPLPDGGARLVFDEPLRAPAPGQAAVVYRGDEVLGGGIISIPCVSR